MPNSTALGWVGGGQTVRAWCLTGFSAQARDGNVSTGTMTANNFINGYNLIFDDIAYNAQLNATTTSQTGISTGAIPFKFITPMPDTRYKIFVQPRTVSNSNVYSDDGRAFLAHALNTTQYPKTVNGFWVRFGMMIRGNDNNGAGADTFITNISALIRPSVGQMLNRTIAASTYQLQVVVV